MTKIEGLKSSQTARSVRTRNFELRPVFFLVVRLVVVRRRLVGSDEY
jgi:hypothetical protein